MQRQSPQPNQCIPAKQQHQSHWHNKSNRNDNYNDSFSNNVPIQSVYPDAPNYSNNECKQSTFFSDPHSNYRASPPPNQCIKVKQQHQSHWDNESNRNDNYNDSFSTNVPIQSVHPDAPNYSNNESPLYHPQLARNTKRKQQYAPPTTSTYARQIQLRGLQDDIDRITQTLNELSVTSRTELMIVKNLREAGWIERDIKRSIDQCKQSQSEVTEDNVLTILRQKVVRWKNPQGKRPVFYK